MITWTPIADLPERCKDGRDLRLKHKSGYTCTGWYCSSQNHWWAHSVDFIKALDTNELSHFSELTPPDTEEPK